MASASLPEPVARVRVEDNGKASPRTNPAKKFLLMVLDGVQVRNRYTVTTPEYFYKKGKLVECERPTYEYLNHFHRAGRENDISHPLLASLRKETRFGKHFLVLDIYDPFFADEVSALWKDTPVVLLYPKQREVPSSRVSVH